MAKRKRRDARGLVPVEPEVIARAIAKYRARGVAPEIWAQVGPFVRHAVVLSDPESVSSVYLTARAVADVTVWAFERGMPLDIESLFVEDTIEHFTSTQLGHLAPKSRADYRSGLRRIARDITKKAPWPADPEAHGRERSAGPCSPEELSWLRQIAMTQATTTRRRAAMTVWCLAYGAGLRGPEFGQLSGTDILVVDGCVVVSVPGAYPRQVPVLADVADDLLDLASQYPDGPMFSDRGQCRGWTSAVISQIEVPHGAPSFDLRRLRITWQVKLATAGIRLSELAYLSGVESSSGWDDVARWVPRRDFTELAAIIGGIDG